MFLVRSINAWRCFVVRCHQILPDTPANAGWEAVLMKLKPSSLCSKMPLIPITEIWLWEESERRIILAQRNESGCTFDCSEVCFSSLLRSKRAIKQTDLHGIPNQDKHHRFQVIRTGLRHQHPETSSHRLVFSPLLAHTQKRRKARCFPLGFPTSPSSLGFCWDNTPKDDPG